MKKLLSAAAVLLWAGVASAQTIQDAPSGISQSASAIISNASLAYNAGDSSSVLPVGNLKHMKLLLKAVPAAAGDNDTTHTTWLAFQIRTHLNGASDSNSVFVEYPQGVTSVGVSVAAQDSFKTGHLAKGGRGGTAGIPWAGEFLVAVQHVRKAHGSSIAVNGHDWYYPNGIAIPLDSVFGREFVADNMSVRVRNLTSVACGVTVNLVGQR